MSQGRGSCMAAIFVCFLIVETLASTTYIVGDSQGWGFSASYTDWANGKSFAAGDTLVFNYQKGQHNAVAVTVASYNSCMASPSEISKAGTSGNDAFTLMKGPNYFLCSFVGHCTAGMKIQVNAN